MFASYFFYIGSADVPSEHPALYALYADRASDTQVRKSHSHAGGNPLQQKSNNGIPAVETPNAALAAKERIKPHN